MAGIAHFSEVKQRVGFPQVIASTIIQTLGEVEDWRRYDRKYEGSKVGIFVRFNRHYQYEAADLLTAIGIQFSKKDQLIVLDFADEGSAYVAFRYLASSGICSILFVYGQKMCEDKALFLHLEKNIIEIASEGVKGYPHSARYGLRALEALWQTKGS